MLLAILQALHQLINGLDLIAFGLKLCDVKGSLEGVSWGAEVQDGFLRSQYRIAGEDQMYVLVWRYPHLQRKPMFDRAGYCYPRTADFWTPNTNRTIRERVLSGMSRNIRPKR